jgi:hypothetical protein
MGGGRAGGGGGGVNSEYMLTRLNILLLNNSSLHYFKLFFMVDICSFFLTRCPLELHIIAQNPEVDDDDENK